MADPEFGNRIGRLRRRRGVSQVVLAGLVGRSESWLSQVERGVRDVDSLAVLRDLARVLRVDPDDLVPGSTTSGLHTGRPVEGDIERALSRHLQVNRPRRPRSLVSMRPTTTRDTPRS